ncbi:MAG: universal stress protein [Spirochaetales bacterium]|nr:universal stress protein [Spirochaetales bacterium]
MTQPIRRILVNIDGSEDSITAAQYAMCLAKTLGAELTALYVVNTKALNDLVKTRIFLQSEEEEYRKDMEADAERYLRHVKDLAAAKGIFLQTEKRVGSVHAEIRKVVEETESDLLVIGAIAKIRSRRDEFYDEAERAMRTVTCPVLLVKNPDRVLDLYEDL